MRREDLIDIFTREQRIDLHYPGVRREVEGGVIRHISLTGEDGFVIYSDLRGQDIDAAIEAQIACFERLEQSFEWKVYDYDYPANLIERLARRGFDVEDAEALLVLDLAEGPAVLSHPVPPSVTRLTDPGEVDEVVWIEERVWGTDHSYLGERLRRDLSEDPEGLCVYLARVDGQPASAAWVYFHTGSRFASLWGGSTLAEYRGQGLYTALFAARAQEAWRRGFSLLTVDASPMSQPILEKHGFQLLAFSSPCKWVIIKNQP